MNRLALALILLVYGTSAAAETITRKDLVGAWARTEKIEGKEQATCCLVIGVDLSVTFTDEKKAALLMVAPSDVSFTDDVLIINMRNDGVVVAKYVLSGWITKRGDKRLFGMVYPYSNGGIDNGLAITYAPHGS